MYKPHTSELTENGIPIDLSSINMDYTNGHFHEWIPNSPANPAKKKNLFCFSRLVSFSWIIAHRKQNEQFEIEKIQKFSSQPSIKKGSATVSGGLPGLGKKR